GYDGVMVIKKTWGNVSRVDESTKGGVQIESLILYDSIPISGQKLCEVEKNYADHSLSRKCQGLKQQAGFDVRISRMFSWSFSLFFFLAF
ncbi:hypothetical protein ACMD2_24033, partial [Ananas comosus]